MTACILFIDSDHAKLFKLGIDKVETENLKRTEIHHHTASDKDKLHKDGGHFFNDVASKLKGMKEILLVGPGLAKNHFKTHLEKHHHAELAKHIVGLETVDHPTDNQIIAVGRKFFKNYDKFN